MSQNPLSKNRSLPSRKRNPSLSSHQGQLLFNRRNSARRNRINIIQPSHRVGNLNRNARNQFLLLPIRHKHLPYGLRSLFKVQIGRPRIPIAPINNRSHNINALLSNRTTKCVPRFSPSGNQKDRLCLNNRPRKRRRSRLARTRPNSSNTTARTITSSSGRISSALASSTIGADLEVLLSLNPSKRLSWKRPRRLSLLIVP